MFINQMKISHQTGSDLEDWGWGQGGGWLGKGDGNEKKKKTGKEVL